MKKILSILLITALLMAGLPTIVWAADDAWTYNSSAGTLTNDSNPTWVIDKVTATGTTLKIGDGNILSYTGTTLDFSGGIKEGTNTFTVTEIADIAFIGNTSLTKVNLPHVVIIGSQAFFDCAYLQSADMPNVTTIKHNAFAKCVRLATVRMPNVITIDGAAFSDTALTNVYLPEATSIGNQAFNDCTNLTSLNMPNVTTIGSSAFYNCTNLASLNMPNVTTIGPFAFSNCTNLNTLTILTAAPPDLVLSGTFNAFTYLTQKITIIVKPGTEEAWKIAPEWKDLIANGRIIIVPQFQTSGRSYTPASFTFTQNSYNWTSGNLTMKCTGEYADFTELYIDGNLLKRNTDYTVKAGSTIFTIKASYLKKLSNGDHTVTAYYTNGYGQTTLTINGNPKTGDDSNVVLWGVVAVMAMGALFVLKRKFGLNKRKNNQAIYQLDILEVYYETVSI